MPEHVRTMVSDPLPGTVPHMPDRPRNGGPEDGPDYHWLYGQGGPPEDPQATRPVPRQSRPGTPRPEETRVMRAQPRPPAQERRASRPTPPPVAPPVDQSRSKRRRRFRARYVWILLLLWLVFLLSLIHI